MGRTIPTATQLLRIIQAEWKPFRNALDKKDRKKFDEMLILAHEFNYTQMVDMASHPVPLQAILMTIAFQHYKEIMKLISEFGLASSYENWGIT